MRGALRTKHIDCIKDIGLHIWHLTNSTALSEAIGKNAAPTPRDLQAAPLHRACTPQLPDLSVALAHPQLLQLLPALSALATANLALFRTPFQIISVDNLSLDHDTLACTNTVFA